MSDLKFNNTFKALGSAFYTEVQPQGLPNPQLIGCNSRAGKLIGLGQDQLTSEWFLAMLSGNCLPHGCEPLAMVYSGHQFGHYNPQLGDGRGLLLGQVEGEHNHWDLHLKGAGLTPYSRHGNGRAVSRSTIREYLCSEAMFGLGIPTTRGLAIAGSDLPVYRETVETGAVLLRLAESHVRFGSFEYFYYTGQHDLVVKLADYVLAINFPHLLDCSHPYKALFTEVVQSTAKLIAHWQSVGFCHGVMNTDNMSILGQTFDYGPFAFLDDYDYGYICNHSDYDGRYAFNQQPYIGLWNCHALAQTFSQLVDETDIKSILASYEPTLMQTYWQLMSKKLGFIIQREEDKSLIGDLLKLMEKNNVDYSIFFR